MRNTSEPIHIFNTRPVTTIKIDNNLLFVALSAPFSFGGGQGFKLHEHPGIKIWDLKNNEEIGTLPGNGYICNLETHNSGLYVSSTDNLIKHTSNSYDNTYEALQDADFTTMDNKNPIYSKDIQEDDVNCVIS